MAERKPVTKATTAVMAAFFPNNSSSPEEFSLPFDASEVCKTFMFARGSVVCVENVVVGFTVAVWEENNKI